MSVGELISTDERPPYVRFERQVVEDKAASIREGRYVGMDVDFVLVTPAGSKDEMPSKVDRWFETTKRNVSAGRMNPKWLKYWEEGYKRWKSGQEMPLNGTPIKGWGMISPAMQETLIRMRCMTIEDLAVLNDEGLRRVGMGSMELRNKAKNWLQAIKDQGPLVTQVTALEQENKILKEQVETLITQVAALKNAPQVQQQIVSHVPEITAEELLADEPVEKIESLPIVPKRRGRPPKVK